MFFSRRTNKTQKSRPTSPARRSASRLPLSLEYLENRILLSADNWMAGSGNWNVGSNWSLNHAPGTGDTAVIDTATAATITILATDKISVQSVTTGSNDTLSIVGGALTVASGASTLSGALAMTGGSVTATGAGVSLTANGSTAISGASLNAKGGASLNLPQMTSFTGDNLTLTNGSSVTVQGSDIALPAAGTSGATIDVPSIQGLSVTLDNSGTLSGTTINVGQGATAVLAGGTYLAGGTFNVAQGATVDITGGQTDTYGGTFTGTGTGTGLFGGGNVKVAAGGMTLNFPGEVFQWTGGIFRTSLGDVTNQGTMNLTGPNEKAVYEDGTLDNHGTIIQSGSGNLGLHSDSVKATTLHNEAGAYYLIESDAGIDNPFGGVVSVQNEGVIRKTAGTGASTLQIGGDLNNTGIIEADSGTLALAPNSIDQVLLSGILLGTTVTTNIYSNYSSSATSAGGAPYSNLVGTLTTSSIQFLTSTGFNWHPLGQTSFGADSTSSLTVTVPGTYSFGLDSADGALLYIDGKLVVNDGGVHTAQTATGTATLTAGSHTYEVQFFNDGSGQSGVDMYLTVANPLLLTSGTWNALNGATLSFPSGENIASNAANVSLGGSGASIPALDSLNSNSGSLSLSSGANLTTVGDLSNSGSLTVGAGSTLTVQGNYTQTAAATLNVQIGGASSSGQVAVKGAANLAGSFNVNLVNGFTPDRGLVYQYPVLTYASTSGTFATVTGLGSYFTEQTNSTNLEIANSTGNPVSMQLSQVTAPTAATVGQQVTIDWQVSNSGSNAANGNWQDSVYLSTTPTITGSSLLLGSVTHSGGLAAGASYNGSLTSAVPVLPPGNYYVVVQADSLYQLPVTSRANFVLAASTGQLAVSVPALSLGKPSAGTFTAADQDQYYQVSVPAGGTLQVALTSAASSGALALYVSRGNLPTPYGYQAAGNLAGEPNQSANLPVLAAGTSYILVESVSGAAATSGYTLTATQTTALSVSAISSYPGGNAGNVTVEIDGANFTAKTTATLTLGSTTLTASSMYFTNGGQLFATFNLSGATPGGYTLSVQQGSQSATAPTLFQVVAAKPNNGLLATDFGVPSAFRAGRTGTITLTYENKTANDIVAPFLSITSNDPDVSFSTPDDPNNFVQQGQVLAVATSGPAGILRPGQSGQLTLTLLTSGSGGTKVPLDLGQLQGSKIIDWASLESSVKPSTISSAAWNVIYSNLTAMVGTTTTSYNAALAQAATYLGNLGEPTSQLSDIGRLWLFLVAQASAAFPTTTLASTTDASLPTPGSLALSISRTIQSSIASRYSSGMFGLGWTTPWQSTLSVDSSGTATIDTSGASMSFSALPNGNYLESAGVFGTLTQSGGVYTYTNTSGIQSAFSTNGLLNYQQDANGNRITLGYNAQNQIVSLTYSNPSDPSQSTEQLTLTYNAQGFVSQVSDGAGNTWTYSYDASGHLLSLTAPGGLTTSYTYDTGSNPETANTLLSITNPDGARTTYTYDAATGRLTGSSLNGGANPISYAFDGQGEVTTTDASGDQTTTWYNDLGRPGRVEGPLGGISTYSYDVNGNMTSSTDAGGNTYLYSYNTNGKLAQIVNPLGQTVEMTYGPLGHITSVTDANGNTTQYSYSSTGNLLSIAYADGTQQSSTYDPLGNPLQTVLQNGDPIKYQYNAQGLVAQESFADGTSQTFTYDAHGNIRTASTYDAKGNLTGTTTETYNAANDLTSITYANGQNLQFTYNAAGQRTQSVDQSGYTLNYTYDALGRLSKLADGSGNLIVQYTYNNVGELVKKVNGNGTYTTYAYDKNGNLTEEANYANSSGTTVNSSFTYTYNVLNQPTSVKDSAGNVTSYAYDALGELTQVTLPNGTSIRYVYNAAGDLTQVLSNGTATSYSSNADNEITQVGSTTYTYDKNGNLHTVTDASGTTTFTFNDLNELLSITNPNGSVQSFQYSPLGFQVGKSTTSGGTTSQTNYLVDPTGMSGMSNVVAAYNGSGSLIAHYNYGLGLVSQTGPSGTGYYDFDAKGNTVGITGANGTYANLYSYQPFGQTTTLSAALPNPFTFAGQFGVMQIAPNLFYMRARDYTPAPGQFLSNDPLGLKGGETNLRSYASNAPNVFVDPTGKWFLWFTGAPFPPGTTQFLYFRTGFRFVPGFGILPIYVLYPAGGGGGGGLGGGGGGGGGFGGPGGGSGSYHVCGWTA